MITDEMVEAALFKLDPSFKNLDNSERQVKTWKLAMREALTAVLPMIRAEVLEEAPKGCICPPGSETTCQRKDCGRKEPSSAVPAPWRPDQWLGYGKVG